MSILQVVTDTDRRGAQVFATDLATALRTRGHEVRTVALGPGLHGGRLEVPVLGPNRLGPRTLMALRREIRGVDVVVAHGSSTLPACAVATLRTGTPFVYRQISDSRFWASTAGRRLRVRTSLSRAAAVVALSAAAADVLVDDFGVGRSRVHVVPNGVPAAGFAPATDEQRRAARQSFGLDPDRPVVLSISALVPEKGVDRVIDAMADLGDGPDPSAHTMAQLLVVGDGPERANLAAQADRRLGSRARFAGALTDAQAAFVAADVLVLASRGGDSMPATLIEAGFCGVPAVATPVGAIADVVVDGVSGVVVPIDDREALRSAISQLVHDPGRRAQLGAAAREHCQARFEIGLVADRWAAVLARAAGSAAARRPATEH